MSHQIYEVYEVNVNKGGTSPLVKIAFLMTVCCILILTVKKLEEMDAKIKHYNTCQPQQNQDANQW